MGQSKRRYRFFAWAGFIGFDAAAMLFLLALLGFLPDGAGLACLAAAPVLATFLYIGLVGDPPQNDGRPNLTVTPANATSSGEGRRAEGPRPRFHGS